VPQIVITVTVKQQNQGKTFRKIILPENHKPFVQIIPQHIAEHVTHVQGHKVKYSDYNNTSVDGSISLKFGTEIQHVTDDTVQMLKVMTAMDR